MKNIKYILRYFVIILPLMFITLNAQEEEEVVIEEAVVEVEAPAEEAVVEAEEAVVEAEEAVEDVSIAEAIEDSADGGSPLSGWNIGVAPSVGYLSGATFTSIPTGVTAVINTPYGFKLGPFDFNISAAFGGYTGSHEGETGTLNFNPTVMGVGGNLTFNVPFIPFDVFGEGHVGMVGNGPGVRGFGGVSLESLLKKGLNLPFNLLVGGEVFISSDMAGVGNPSGWLSIGARLDYGF
ncbi:MAG: hypothetical protein HOK52_13810 [Candidatus Marinimicrobia bacterium]|nr:hypothetical protein [Candidatus Neomarinimicrobiota bacterium]MBT6938387.1 hypothetical protein [Candidatus Neomarinimicrobiota bacterium]